MESTDLKRQDSKFIIMLLKRKLKNVFTITLNGSLTAYDRATRFVPDSIQFYNTSPPHFKPHPSFTLLKKFKFVSRNFIFARTLQNLNIMKRDEEDKLKDKQSRFTIYLNLGLLFPETMSHWSVFKQILLLMAPNISK